MKKGLIIILFIIIIVIFGIAIFYKYNKINNTNTCNSSNNTNNFNTNLEKNPDDKEYIEQYKQELNEIDMKIEQEVERLNKNSEI